MSLLTWILLLTVYVVLFATVGLYTMRKGHTVLFVIGFLFPILWIVGAMLRPTRRVETADARSSLRRT